MREQTRVVLTVARDPLLARIELAYLGFNMAEYATWMAILVFAYDLGGAGTAALFATVVLIPAGILAPIASSFGDRFRQDRVLLAGYVWQAVSLLATGVSLYLAPPVVTLVVAVVGFLSFTVTRPVQAGILPSATHSPSDLTAANAVSGLAENVASFIGPLAGGLLLAARSEPGDVFVVFAAISLFGAVLVASCRQASPGRRATRLQRRSAGSARFSARRRADSRWWRNHARFSSSSWSWRRPTSFSGPSTS